MKRDLAWMKLRYAKRASHTAASFAAYQRRDELQNCDPFTLFLRCTALEPKALR